MYLSQVLHLRSAFTVGGNKADPEYITVGGNKADPEYITVGGNKADPEYIRAGIYFNYIRPVRLKQLICMHYKCTFLSRLEESN